MLPIFGRRPSLMDGRSIDGGAAGRRSFLKLGVAAAGSAVLAGGARAQTARPAAPPGEPPWSHARRSGY